MEMSESYIITPTLRLVGDLVSLSIITVGALLLFLLIRICIDMKKCGNLCCPNSCCGLDPPTRIVLQDARTIQNQDVERNDSVCYKACCK